MQRTEQTPPKRRAQAVVIPFPQRPPRGDNQARLQAAVRRMETELARQLQEVRGFQDAARRLDIVMRDLRTALRGYKSRLRFVECELSTTTTRSRYLAGLMGDWSAAKGRSA